MRAIFRSCFIKNIVPAIVVAIAGFALLNITFLFYFLLEQFFRLFRSDEPMFAYQRQWILNTERFLFLVIVGLISWLVFRSKLNTLYKAVYMTVPLAVILVTTGMFFYNLPIILYSVSVLFSAVVLLYLYFTKKPWIYYYTLVLVVISLTVFTLLGGEI